MPPHPLTLAPPLSLCRLPRIACAFVVPTHCGRRCQSAKASPRCVVLPSSSSSTDADGVAQGNSVAQRRASHRAVSLSLASTRCPRTRTRRNVEKCPPRALCLACRAVVCRAHVFFAATTLLRSVWTRSPWGVLPAWTPTLAWTAARNPRCARFDPFADFHLATTSTPSSRLNGARQ